MSSGWNQIHGDAWCSDLPGFTGMHGMRWECCRREVGRFGQTAGPRHPNISQVGPWGPYVFFSMFAQQLQGQGAG